MKLHVFSYPAVKLKLQSLFISWNTFDELKKLFHLEKHFYLQFRLKDLQKQFEWIS